MLAKPRLDSPTHNDSRRRPWYCYGFILVAVASSPVAVSCGSPSLGGGEATNSVPFRSSESVGNFEFGRVREGAVVRHTYLLENSTPVPIRIRDVRTSCGCTKSEEFPSVILAKCTGRFSVEFDSRGRAGAVEQEIYIELTDGRCESRKLTGYVEASHLHAVDFGPVTKGAWPKREFWVQSPPGVTLEIVEVDYDRSLFDIGYKLVEGTPGKFVFQVTPQDALGYGLFEEGVTITTNDTLVPEKKVLVRGYVLHPMEVEPRKLAMGLICEEGKTAAVKVYSPYKYPITVDAVRVVEGEPLEWSLNPASPSEIAMSVTAGSKGDSKSRAFRSLLEVTGRAGELKQQARLEVYGMYKGTG